MNMERKIDSNRMAFVPDGRLDVCPIPLLISQIHVSGLSGLLSIEGEKTTHWIYFEKGRPAAASTSTSEIHFGIVARDLGYIDNLAIQESLMEMARTGLLQGEVLIRLGRLTEKQLRHVLAVQLLRKVTRIFAIKTGTYRFEEGMMPKTKEKPRGINPFPIIINGLWLHYTPAEIHAYLKYLDEKSFRLLPAAASHVNRLGLTDEYSADLSRLSGFQAKADFLDSARTGTEGGSILLAFLLICGFLEIRSRSPIDAAERPRKIDQVSEVPESPHFLNKANEKPDTTGSPAKTFAKLVEDKFEQVQRNDHVAALEISIESSADQIREAYITLSSIYSPLRAALAEEDRLLQMLGIISARLGEAYFVLSHPGRRDVYLENLKSIENSFTINPVAADTAGHHAAVLEQQGKLDGAGNSLELACDLDPTNIEYKTRLTWIRFLQSGSNDSENLERVAAKLKALHGKKPDDYANNVHLAALFELAGDKLNHDIHNAIARRVSEAHDNPREQIRRLVENAGKFIESGRGTTERKTDIDPKVPASTT